MKKFIAVSVLTFFTMLALLFYASTITSASDDKNSNGVNVGVGNGKFKVEIEKHQNGNEDKNNEFNVEIKNLVNSVIDKFKFQQNINKKEFEIKGILSDVTQNSFIINGQKIFIDISVTGRLNQRGVLTNGAYAKVEGKVKDGNLYAVHIKIKSKASAFSPTLSVSATPTTSVVPTATPSTTITPSATPSPEISIDDDVEYKGGFAPDKLILILENLIRALLKL